MEKQTTILVLISLVFIGALVVLVLSEGDATVTGAVVSDDYISKMRRADFKVKILHEDKEISKTQYNGINIESLKFEALK